MSKDRTETLLEEMNHKFDAIMEYVKDVPKIKEKVDVTFEEVGQLRVDVEVIKEELKSINSRLDTLEKAMKILDRNTDEITELRERVKKLEQRA